MGNKGTATFSRCDRRRLHDRPPAMPRIPRGQQAGFVYHVINRGNGRATIFHKPQDYFWLAPVPNLPEGSTASLRSSGRSVRSKRSSRSTASLRSNPCSGSKFKVQEFKEVLRAVPAVPDFPNHVVRRGILGSKRVSAQLGWVAGG